MGKSYWQKAKLHRLSERTHLWCRCFCTGQLAWLPNTVNSLIAGCDVSWQCHDKSGVVPDKQLTRQWILLAPLVTSAENDANWSDKRNVSSCVKRQQVEVVMNTTTGNGKGPQPRVSSPLFFHFNHFKVRTPQQARHVWENYDNAFCRCQLTFSTKTNSLAGYNSSHYKGRQWQYWWSSPSYHTLQLHLASFLHGPKRCADVSVTETRVNNNFSGLFTPGASGKISPTQLFALLMHGLTTGRFLRRRCNQCCQRTELHHDALGVNTKCLNAPGVFRPFIHSQFSNKGWVFFILQSQFFFCLTQFLFCSRSVWHHRARQHEAIVVAVLSSFQLLCFGILHWERKSRVYSSITDFSSQNHLITL